MLVDFQHWIGVFIHAIQMLRSDARHERWSRSCTSSDRPYDSGRRGPGCSLRAIRPLHDALVWEESDDDDEVPVARPVSEQERQGPHARRGGVRRGRRQDQPLVDTRAHRFPQEPTAVAGERLSPSALAVSAAVPAGLVAAVLTRRDHRLVAQRKELV